MVRRGIMMFSALLAGLVSPGCFNSESDYNAMVAQRDALSEELEVATRENKILNQAFDSIKKEQEELQLMLNTAQSHMAAASSPNTQPAPPLPPLAGDSPTISWGGYDWSLPTDSIASDGPGSSTSTPTPPPAPSAGSGGKIYIPKSGDVLSSIAARHNTTVEKLLELNPYLAKRRNYMIWTTDKIVLP